MWLIGFAVLFAVIATGIRLSDVGQFVELVARAKPRWFLVAIALQSTTYLVQGRVWQMVGRAAGVFVSTANAMRLSLIKLFIDQVLPSAGISGSVAVSKLLADELVSQGAAMASVIINHVSYYAAYAALLITALVLAPHNRVASMIGGVAMFAIVVSAGVLLLSRKSAPIQPWALARFPRRGFLKFLQEADPHLIRDNRLFAKSVACQLGIFVLDITTVFVLIHSLGAIAASKKVFVSFMVSTLFRSVGLVPGGVGTFEASSFVTLKLAGLNVPTALSVTLLFRGLSFWIPMLPGFWFFRRALRQSKPGSKSRKKGGPMVGSRLSQS